MADFYVLRRGRMNFVCRDDRIIFSISPMYSDVKAWKAARDMAAQFAKKIGYGGLIKVEDRTGKLAPSEAKSSDVYTSYTWVVPDPAPNDWGGKRKGAGRKVGAGRRNLKLSWGDQIIIKNADGGIVFAGVVEAPIYPDSATLFGTNFLNWSLEIVRVDK